MKISSFVPTAPKGRKGRHNVAKKTAVQLMDSVQATSSARRGFRRRVKKSIETLSFAKTSAASQAGKFCLDMEGSRSPVDSDKTFLLDDVSCRVPASSDKPNQGVFAVDQGTHDFIFARVPARRAAELSSKHKKWQKILVKALGIKPNFKRGEKRNGACDRCVLFGWRKNPRGKEVGEYVFKKSISKDEVEDVELEIARMLKDIEGVAHSFVNPDDLARLKSLKEEKDIPGFAGDSTVSTQFSVARNYSSPMHTDDDFFWTVLSVLGSQKVSKPLQWFVFPEYDVAVPLHSGDIIIFNPLVLHGCTNPTMDSLIFSAYVSAKTVATAVASKDEI